MKMALTAALHARPNPLCIDRARDDLYLYSLEKSFRFILPPKYSVWMGWKNLYKKRNLTRIRFISLGNLCC